MTDAQAITMPRAGDVPAGVGPVGAIVMAWASGYQALVRAVVFGDDVRR
ncbi:hypothetical protein EV137_4382 [Kribbella pratensis]|uniref:Uncharacterized protein n=1 Tax=Kribbella pratensis TaxID=2512112 RepID=A0ABY2FGQ3_9ACTN|nr:hypothetical protein EV137_4382 [Kribbella pratensis]TDW98293.1 hypothetical protein EV647_2999 [Kribbella sp. VKM Ac-2566]